MLIVGLTGGIASGKTTVARLFAQHGVPIIDADEISREVVVPSSPCLAAIKAQFGPAMLTQSGELDRVAMRQLIFSDPNARSQLEAILHPVIREKMRERIGHLNAPYAILVIPLLVETGQHALANRVLVVDIPEALQRSRLRMRDNIDDKQIDAILHSQVPRHQRLAHADDIIDNQGDVGALDQSVETLHRRYLTMATPTNPN